MSTHSGGGQLPLPSVARRPPTRDKPASKNKKGYQRTYGLKPRPLVRQVPRGYSQFAAYIDSHEDAPVFRRFGNLKARVLLTKQAEIAAKETELYDIDQLEHIQSQGDGGSNRNFPDNGAWTVPDHEKANAKRKRLIGEIAILLREYENDLILYRQMRSLPKAEDWQAENLDMFLQDTQQIHPTECGFLDDMEDLVTTAPDDIDNVKLWGPLRKGYACILYLLSSVFPTRSAKALGDKELFEVRTKTGMKIISRLLYGVLVAVVMTAGVVIIYHCKTNLWRMLAMFLATVCLAVCTAVFTTARKSEIFSIAAAYCAVLVVFIGSVLDKDASVVDLTLWPTSRINGTITP